MLVKPNLAQHAVWQWPHYRNRRARRTGSNAPQRNRGVDTEPFLVEPDAAVAVGVNQAGPAERPRRHAKSTVVVSLVYAHSANTLFELRHQVATQSDQLTV